MDEDGTYDWVDDENLDLTATLARLRSLRGAVVVTRSPREEAGSTTTVAGRSFVLIKETDYGPRRQAAFT
jgi:hypothetical protein